MGVDRLTRFVPSRRAQRFAALWIFPGLVAAMIIGNQGWTLGPFAIGQILSWLNDLAAVVLVLGRFSGRRWPLLLIGFTLAAKAASRLGPFADLGDLGFDVGLGLLFCAAGAIIVSERPGIVYRQALAIAVLCIPLMLIQMTGIAEWSEALNTEHTEDTGRPGWTLFVREADMHYRTAQARPTGLTHSNNFVSLLAVFTMALHFACIRTSGVTRRDVIVCAFAILTMAKVALLIGAVIIAWKLVTGVRLERRRMARVTGLVAVLVGTYAFLFPGLFTANTSLYKVGYSFFIRANNFVELLPADSGLRRWLAAALEGTPRAGWEQGAALSGYSQIIAILPYVVVGAVLLAPLFYHGFRTVRRRYPAIVDMMVLTLFVVVLYPTAVPMFRAQIFAFIAGFALLPLFTIWETRRFQGPVGTLMLTPMRPAGTAR
jgi:hypothetical protein